MKTSVDFPDNTREVIEAIAKASNRSLGKTVVDIVERAVGMRDATVSRVDRDVRTSVHVVTFDSLGSVTGAEVAEILDDE